MYPKHMHTKNAENKKEISAESIAVTHVSMVTSAKY